MDEAGAGIAFELQRVDAYYGTVCALRDACLRVRYGEIHALLGASGSGKTTLLRVVAGLERARRGRVEVGGIVADDPERPRAFVPPERRRVGVVFQDYALFPHLDVAGNVAFGMRPRRDAEVSALLARVGLEGLERRRVSELSGGQQQRVALARALARAPRVMLLDEPFSNVDRVLRRRMRDETVAVLRSAGLAALFVTHDVEEAFAVADRVTVVSHGRLVQTGTPRALYLRPSSLEAAASTGEVLCLPAVRVSDDRAQCALGEVSVDATHGPAGSGYVLLRPEQLRVGGEGPVQARVTGRSFLGPQIELQLTLASGERVTTRSSRELPESDVVNVLVVGPGMFVSGDPSVGGQEAAGAPATRGRGSGP